MIPVSDLVASGMLDPPERTQLPVGAGRADDSASPVLALLAVQASQLSEVLSILRQLDEKVERLEHRHDGQVRQNRMGQR